MGSSASPGRFGPSRLSSSPTLDARRSTSTLQSRHQLSSSSSELTDSGEDTRYAGHPQRLPASPADQRSSLANRNSTRTGEHFTQNDQPIIYYDDPPYNPPSVSQTTNEEHPPVPLYDDSNDDYVLAQYAANPALARWPRRPRPITGVPIYNDSDDEEVLAQNAANPAPARPQQRHARPATSVPLYNDSDDSDVRAQYAANPAPTRLYRRTRWVDGVPIYNDSDDSDVIAQYAAHRAADAERRRQDPTSSSSSGSEESGSSDGGSSSPRSVPDVDGDVEMRLDVASPGSTQDSPPAEPPSHFNPERYPAYDANARRIGLEHVRYDGPTDRGGSPAHYRSRTQNYPPEGVPETRSSAKAPARSRRARTNTPAVPDSPKPAVSSRRLRSHDVPTEYSPSAAGDMSLVPESEEGSDEDFGDPTETLRQQLDLEDGDEINLNALADPPPGEKPEYPYPTLIKLAIHGSKDKRLTLQGIYLALENRFEWYRNHTEDKAWQNSIRHNLSLNKCFRRMSKPITEPGKGSYWVLDYSKGEGNKRTRKRNRKLTKTEQAATGRSTASPYRTPVQPAPRMLQPEPMLTMDNSEAYTTVFRVPGSARMGISPQDPNASFDMSNIDPALLNMGHVVGEGRINRSGVRSHSRKTNSPYARGRSITAEPSPAQQHVQLPPMVYEDPDANIDPVLRNMSLPTPGNYATHIQTGRNAMHITLPSLPSIGLPMSAERTLAPLRLAAFNQPTFGQPSFAPPAMNINSMSFTADAQPVASTSRRTQAHEIRNAPIRLPTPRPGVEVVRDPNSLVTARRVTANPPARSSRRRRKHKGSSESE